MYIGGQVRNRGDVLSSCVIWDIFWVPFVSFYAQMEEPMEQPMEEMEQMGTQ